MSDTSGDDASGSFKHRALSWVYDKLVSGSIPGQKSCQELAADYSQLGLNSDEKVDNFINWQCGKSGVAGFISGGFGFASAPITIPAEFITVSYIHLRMVAVIAILYGHDLKDDRVKTLCMASLLGSSLSESVSKGGSFAAEKFAKAGVKKVSGKILKRVNSYVPFKLITKTGKTGLINLGKWVPIAGAVAGSGINAAGTRALGMAAKTAFRNLQKPDNNN